MSRDTAGGGGGSAREDGGLPPVGDGEGGPDASDRVLVVDDEPDAADLAATYLERFLDGIETVVVTSPDEALAVLRERCVDCVVSDYDMPGRDGLELLSEIRASVSDVPFVLFTGKGSEEIASEAISAGVTDYLRKGTGADQYEVLANRVDNALRRRRAEARSRARGEAIGRYETILATLQDPVFTLDPDGRIAYANDALGSLTGVPVRDLVGSDPAEVFADDPPAGIRAVADGAVGPDEVVADQTVADGDTVLVETADGGTVRCESRVSRVEGADDALACVLRDVSERARAESELRDVNRKVTAIHEFATGLSSADGVDEVFAKVVDAAERILNFDRSVAARRDGDRLQPVALSADVGTDDVRSFEVGEGIAGRTVAEERTFLVDDLRERDDADPETEDVRSVLSVPIGTHGHFQAVAGEPDAFDETDVEFAELVASHAGDAIDQIRAEAALRTEHDRLAALFENLPLPVARIEIDGSGDQSLDATNEAFEETFGFSAETDSYLEAREAMLPEDGTRVGPEAVEDDVDAAQVEIRRRTTDGVRDFILNAIPVEDDERRLVYSVYADIGEQKRIERTLRGLHEATREMFRGEDREEVAEVAARTAIDTLGFPNSGVRLYDPEADALEPTVLSPEATDAVGDRPPFGSGDSLIWEAFAEGEPVAVADLNAVETAVGYGDLRSLLVVPLNDHGVMPLGATEPDFFDESDVQLARVLAANVTVALDRAERAEQLRERDAALQREIERLEQFAGVVSHDLRNPLNVAMGRLDLARHRVDDEAVLSELDRIERAHDRMTRLIEDLLTLARQGRTVDDAEPVDLGGAASRAWRTVETEAATLDGPEDDVVIDADPERLRTLLENLFRNAVEHAGDAVAVTVEATADGFAVADDGPGIEMDPEEAMEYGVSGSSDGTGFGLSIVREIADAHGWETTIDESADGARFEFRT